MTNGLNRVTFVIKFLIISLFATLGVWLWGPKGVFVFADDTILENCQREPSPPQIIFKMHWNVKSNLLNALMYSRET